MNISIFSICFNVSAEHWEHKYGHIENIDECVRHIENIEGIFSHLVSFLCEKIKTKKTLREKEDHCGRYLEINSENTI